MSEVRAYESFRKHALGPSDRVDRVENLLVMGMPDINLCIRGHHMWIELKTPTEPKRPATPLFGSNHKVSQPQMNWFLRNNKAGGIGWILIASNKRWLLIDSAHADRVNSMTVDTLIANARWHALKSVSAGKWAQLRFVLTGEAL